MYPCSNILHPTVAADNLQAFLPKGLGGLVALFRNWTYALFYIMSELWGSVAISLLFWGFANDITRVSESKRFYAMFGLGANFAMLFSGPAIIYFSDIRIRLYLFSYRKLWIFFSCKYASKLFCLPLYDSRTNEFIYIAERFYFDL